MNAPRAAAERLLEAVELWMSEQLADTDMEQARADAQALLDFFADEHCCVCGSASVVYHNFNELPFCAPCANGGGAA